MIPSIIIHYGINSELMGVYYSRSGHEPCRISCIYNMKVCLPGDVLLHSTDQVMSHVAFPVQHEGVLAR